MVSEQARIYAGAQGLGGPPYWTWVDFASGRHGQGASCAQLAFSGFLRRFGDATQRIQVRLQMGDERVIAHME